MYTLKLSEISNLNRIFGEKMKKEKRNKPILTVALPTCNRFILILNVDTLIVHRHNECARTVMSAIISCVKLFTYSYLFIEF